MVETLIHALLFTDQEAPEERVPERWDRRGWYHDPEAGSGLWHVRRQALRPEARREAAALATRALSRHDALQDISVREVAPAQQDAGNVSSLSLEITGSHNGRAFLFRVEL